MSPVRSDRVYRFEQPPEALWSAIARVEDYRRWWPWLRELDADGLEAGDVWRCTVRPPLPYVLRFSVSIDEVEPAGHVSATVSGDIGGRARLVLTTSGEGSDVRLTSSLQPEGRPLRAVTRLAPWMARFGHDWVLATGVRQFRSRAL